MRGKRIPAEIVDEILRRYPHEKTEDIASSMGIGTSVIYNVASRNGVEKAKLGCKECHREHHSKGLCSIHYARMYKRRIREVRMSTHHYEKGGRRAVQKAPPGWGYVEVGP